MERYEGPIVPGQADDPGDDHDRPLPTCPTCGTLMRRQRGPASEGIRPLACDLHGRQTPAWTTRSAIEGDAA